MSILETSISKNLVLRLYYLSPGIGTQVLDIHLSKDLGVDVINFLSDLLVESKLIFFRDQAILMQQHIEFARCFGDGEIHPFTKMMKTIQRLFTWIMIVIALQRLMSGTLMLRAARTISGFDPARGRSAGGWRRHIIFESGSCLLESGRCNKENV